MKKYLKQSRIEGGWFHLAQEKSDWRAACKEDLDNYTQNGVGRTRREGSLDATGLRTPSLMCNTHHCSFRIRQDIVRHSCQIIDPSRCAQFLSQAT